MYVSINTSVDIDLDDLYFEMSRTEKAYMAELLQDDIESVKTGTYTIQEMDFRDNISKLKDAYYQLTNEQIDAINQITKTI
jgi:hypothetical protein